MGNAPSQVDGIGQDSDSDDDDGIKLQKNLYMVSQTL